MKDVIYILNYFKIKYQYSGDIIVNRWTFWCSTWEKEDGSIYYPHGNSGSLLENLQIILR